MRLILHVGHPKCASTTVQSLLWNNRAYLAGQGLHLLGAGLQLPHENAGWDWPLWDVNQDAQFGDRLVERLPDFRAQGIGSLILSAENLAQPAILAHVQAAFPHCRTTALYYVRRQDDFLVSSWRQWGMKRGISLVQHLLRRVAEGKPEYLAVARHLAQCLGHVAVRVGVLDPAFLEGGTIERDLWAALNLAGVPDRAADQANPSPDRASLIFLAAHPELFASEHDDRAVQQLLAADPLPPRRLRLDAHLQRSLKMLYDGANRDLVQEFLGRPDGESMIQPDNPASATSLSLEPADVVRLKAMLPQVTMPELRRALAAL